MAIGAPVAAQRSPQDQSGAVVQDGPLGRIYVAQPVANVVLVLSATNMSLLDALKVPAAPAALALDASRQRLYVASDAAGVISVFDARSNRLLQQRAIGGRPRGLALSARGAALIVTNATNGAVLRLRVLPTLGTPTPLISLSMDGPRDVLLAPEATWVGQRSLVWARGFQAGEPVDLYWGVQLLKRVVADKAGFVITKLTVPKGVGLGYHLVILMGRWSTRSESTLLNVLRTPPPPKSVAKKAPRSSIFKSLNRLLTPRLVLKPRAQPRGAAQAPAASQHTSTGYPCLPVRGTGVACL